MGTWKLLERGLSIETGAERNAEQEHAPSRWESGCCGSSLLVCSFVHYFFHHFAGERNV